MYVALVSLATSGLSSETTNVRPPPSVVLASAMEITGGVGSSSMIVPTASVSPARAFGLIALRATVNVSLPSGRASLLVGTRISACVSPAAILTSRTRAVPAARSFSSALPTCGGSKLMVQVAVMSLPGSARSTETTKTSTSPSITCASLIEMAGNSGGGATTTSSFSQLRALRSKAVNRKTGLSALSGWLLSAMNCRKRSRSARTPALPAWSCVRCSRRVSVPLPPS
ncbi:MAG: hypothetical protein AW08_03310 [Candidatus Accumulibacter adjunctus]|uniref:Uncharacterized protein n=1 Tax=Candidatus Accumulibacter adjunctus TaxID=1454001 RepID=A0A011NKV8_9PROT|nr:MAG: hypothetical protein AW08_03310 [Candidatus Accumulibacter adjunctus]